MKISMRINGRQAEFDTSPETRLSDLLKSSAKIQSIRNGCYRGTCGGCYIFFNGDLSASCLIPAFQARNAEIVTFEGLSKTDEINDILKGFEDAGYTPCSYCRPSRIITIHSLLENYTEPDEHQILDAISGIQCSCSDLSTLIRGISAAAGYRRRRRRARNS